LKVSTPAWKERHGSMKITQINEHRARDVRR
jgi:hypothetical protein